METAETIHQLEALRKHHAEQEAAWEAEKARLMQALGGQAYEIKCLKGMLRDRVPEVVE